MYRCYLEDTVSRVKKQAEKIINKSEKTPDFNINYVVLKGDPAEEILDYADKKKIDLIILAAQGKSGIRRWALGNVANKVISATGKQVLLIRVKGKQPDVSKVKLTKVLVPVDGSHESESILKFISYLALKLNLQLTLLHMFSSKTIIYITQESIKLIEKKRKEQKNYVKRLETRLRSQGLRINSIFSEISSGEEALEIIKLAEKGSFSMVAMATHGRSGLGRWIFGSNAQKVLYEGSTPLLLVRPPKVKKNAS